MRVLFSLTTKLSKRKNHDLGSEPTPLTHQLLPADVPPSRLLCLLLQLMHPHTNKSISLSLSLSLSCFLFQHILFLYGFCSVLLILNSELSCFTSRQNIEGAVFVPVLNAPFHELCLSFDDKCVFFVCLR
jgi:hypothetical protein